jgi:hypothetical protein
MASRSQRRPHPQLGGPGIADELGRRAEGLADAIGGHPGVVGVLLDGGVSRGYGDHASEIDLVVYVDDTAADVPVPRGVAVMDGSLVDVSVRVLADERDRPRSPVERWDLSYARVLHDPSGAVQAMLDAALEAEPDVADASGPLFGSWWHYRLAGDAWIARGDPLQAHLMLTLAVPPLVEALFLANDEHVPHEKWLIHLSRSLAWLPERWEERLARALATGDGSTRAAASRQEVLDGLWQDVDARVRARAFPDLPPGLTSPQAPFYELLAWLADRGTVSVAEWEARASLAQLAAEPFWSCAARVGDAISYSPDPTGASWQGRMYAWHAAIADAVQDRRAR